MEAIRHIEEDAIEEGLFHDPASWLGCDDLVMLRQQVSLVKGPRAPKRSRIDILAVDRRCRLVIIEVKLELVDHRALKQAEEYAQRLHQASVDAGDHFITSSLGIEPDFLRDRWCARFGTGFRLPSGKPTIALVGQLVHPEFDARRARYETRVHTIIDVLPGPMPRRSGHPKRTQHLDYGRHPGIVVGFMEQHQPVPRSDVVTFMRDVCGAKRAPDNVDFWTGRAQDRVHGIIGPQYADSAAVKSRYEVDEHGGRVAIRWRDESVRKTDWPACLGRFQASI